MQLVTSWSVYIPILSFVAVRIMKRSCVFLARSTSQSPSSITLGNLWTFDRFSPSFPGAVIRSSSGGLLSRSVSLCIWGRGDRLGIASSPPRSLLGGPNVPPWWHLCTSNYVKMTLCSFGTETPNQTASSLSSRQHNTQATNVPVRSCSTLQ